MILLGIYIYIYIYYLPVHFVLEAIMADTNVEILAIFKYCFKLGLKEFGKCK